MDSAIPESWSKSATQKPTHPIEHPVDQIQSNSEKQATILRNFTLANVYGLHMPLRLHMEQMALSQYQRLPGLPSSFVGLETMLGKDEELGFEDYLNDPEYSVESIDIHEAMEQRLGMGVSKLQFR